MKQKKYKLRKRNLGVVVFAATMLVAGVYQKFMGSTTVMTSETQKAAVAHMSAFKKSDSGFLARKAMETEVTAFSGIDAMLRHTLNVFLSGAEFHSGPSAPALRSASKKSLQ